MSRLLQWLKNEKGASMVEYALLVVLIAVVALTAVAFMGEEVSGLFSEIDSNLLGAKS
jgi:pilus assembly protein Flp/PilA